jgi:hypothetical protein
MAHSIGAMRKNGSVASSGSELGGRTDAKCGGCGVEFWHHRSIGTDRGGANKQGSTHSTPSTVSTIKIIIISILSKEEDRNRE